MFALKTNSSRFTAIAGAAALIAGGIVGLTGTAAEAAALTYTVTPASGPHASSTVVSITGKDFKSAAGTSKVGATANTHVQLATSCGTSSTTSTGKVTSGITSFSVNSATRVIAVLAPGGLATDAKTAFKICVYSTTGTALLGSATFTAYPVPTVTATTPATGATFGGQTVALDGTNFTSKSTVKVGGVAATNVKFIDDTSLTFSTPATATAGAANIVVTTEGGDSPVDGGDAITYVRTIEVTPNIIPVSTATQITVRGYDFKNAALSFGTTSNIVLTTVGAYSAATDDAVVCGATTVISDTELTCLLPTVATAKSYNVVVTADNGVTAATAPNTSYLTGITGGSTLTVAQF